MGPVIDQNSNYARFAIYFNKNMYDYIVDNTLYTREGQATFDRGGENSIQWPRGAYTVEVKEDQIGSIMVKAAWKILGENDVQNRFHSRMAYVYNPGGGAFGQEPVVKESCTVEELHSRKDGTRRLSYCASHQQCARLDLVDV